MNVNDIKNKLWTFGWLGLNLPSSSMLQSYENENGEEREKSCQKEFELCYDDQVKLLRCLKTHNDGRLNRKLCDMRRERKVT